MKQMRPLFRRILFVMSFGLLALALTLFIQDVWAALVITNLKASPAIPWAVALMALFLWLGWKYASGKWRPRSTAAARRRYLRASRVPGRVCSLEHHSSAGLPEEIEGHSSGVP